MKRFLMVSFLFLIYLSMILVVACGDDDDDDDNDVSETCDLEVLEAQAGDLCGAGGEVRYTGKADSDEECGATCEDDEVAYWYDQYGACSHECFCCGPSI